MGSEVDPKVSEVDPKVSEVDPKVSEMGRAVRGGSEGSEGHGGLGDKP